MIGIDPGTTQSAIVDVHPNGSIKAHATLPNTELEKQLRLAHDYVAIERVACQGMAVGQTVFDTCVWIGRFIAAAKTAHVEVFLVFRRDVKLYICGNQQAKDANIRRALIDRYGEGSAKKGKQCPKCKGCGYTRKKVLRGLLDSFSEKINCSKCNGLKWLVPPGKLAEIHEHEWSALAVAVTAQQNPECLVTPE